MISVCMATYNGGKYIKRQVDSILSQLSADDELIISDDGSTDATLEIIRSIKDPRIRQISHIPNESFSSHEKATANFENALKHAVGDYIFLSDQDDIWTIDKIPVCLAELQKSDFVVHNMAVVSVDEKMIRERKFDKNPLPSHVWSVIFHMKLWGCCMCFSREVLSKCLPFPHKLIGHDYWIAILAVKHFSCAYISEPLLIYREHSDSVSYKKKRSLCYKLSYRLRLFLQQIGR